MRARAHDSRGDAGIGARFTRPAWLRRPPPWSLSVEAAILVVGLAAAGDIGVSEPARLQALMYTPLPLLLWPRVALGLQGQRVALCDDLCMTLAATRAWSGLPVRRSPRRAFRGPVLHGDGGHRLSLCSWRPSFGAGAGGTALKERLAFERLLSEVCPGSPAGRVGHCRSDSGALGRSGASMSTGRRWHKCPDEPA